MLVVGCGTQTTTKPEIKLTGVETFWVEQVGNWSLTFSPDISFDAVNIGNNKLKNVSFKVDFINPTTKKNYGSDFVISGDIQPGFTTQNVDMESTSGTQLNTTPVANNPIFPKGSVEAVVTYSSDSATDIPIGTFLIANKSI